LAQGSVLSSLIFSIYLLDLTRINYLPGELMFYADDVSFLYYPEEHNILNFRIFENKIKNSISHKKNK